jgi:hypothetical protein
MARVAVDGIQIDGWAGAIEERQVSGGDTPRLNRDNDHNLLNLN